MRVSPAFLKTQNCKFVIIMAEGGKKALFNKHIEDVFSLDANDYQRNKTLKCITKLTMRFFTSFWGFSFRT